MRLRCVLPILLLLSLPAAAAGPAKGLLLKPLKDAKGAVEPGLVVIYMPSARTPGAGNTAPPCSDRIETVYGGVTRKPAR